MADITRGVRLPKRPRNPGQVDLVTQKQMFTVYMLHFNGVDGSTTFTDDLGHVFTPSGNAQLDTAQVKFGTASGLFDGTGDFIYTSDSVDLAFGSEDFTIDFWVRFNSLPGFKRILGQANSSGTSSSTSFYAQMASQKINSGVYSGSTGYGITGTTTLVINTWYHVALVRNGNTLTLYLNGTSEGSVSVTGVTVNDSSSLFSIGRYGEFNETASGYDFDGWIDEFRISKGVARWTTNFTPPTSEYLPE